MAMGPYEGLGELGLGMLHRPQRRLAQAGGNPSKRPSGGRTEQRHPLPTVTSCFPTHLQSLFLFQAGQEVPGLRLGVGSRAGRQSLWPSLFLRFQASYSPSPESFWSPGAHFLPLPRPRALRGAIGSPEGFVGTSQGLTQ